MTKLTTEVLKEIIGSYPEYSDEIECVMARQLLAYEQAAKNPIGSFHISGGQVEATTDYCRDGEWSVQDGEVLVYAAPVLPKQPDNLDELMNAVEEVLRISDRDHDAWDRARAAMADIRNGVEAPAQPVSEPSNYQVIPDAYVLDELGRMTLNGVCEPRVSFGAGWNACRAEILKEQPVSEPYKLAKSPEACAWISDGEGLWLGDCGLTWTFFDDGPNENGLKYCPSCGKKVSFIAAPAQESE